MKPGGSRGPGTARVRARDGVTLRIARWGEDASGRAPAVLVHGFTGSVEAWGDIPARLAGQLATRRGVVAVDLPGHGESDAPEAAARYRMQEVARDLLEVLDRLDVERACWVGYSLGGRVALGTAVLHPERTAALVLESASPGLADSDERRARRARDGALADRILDVGMERFVDEWMALPLFGTQRRLPDGIRRAERQRRLRGSPRGLAGTLRGLGTGAQPSFWEDLAGLVRPALLLTGSEDGKFTSLARAMAGRLPDARTAVVEGAGHAVHLEAPDAWLSAVASFLDGVAD